MNEIINLILKLAGMLLNKFEQREAIKNQFHAFYVAFGKSSADLHDDFEKQVEELMKKKQ